MKSTLICWCHLKVSNNGVLDNSFLDFFQYYIIQKEHILETRCLLVLRRKCRETLTKTGQMEMVILNHWISDHSYDIPSSGPFIRSFDHLHLFFLDYYFI